MRLRIAAVVTAILSGGVPSWTQEVSKTATPTVIRTETRVVLVDSVVTDKKGNYVTDLTQKDFKVYEDNKEQTISSFTFEADPNSPLNKQKHYLVLFFDNASVSVGNQMQARLAAQKFVDNNTGPNKYIAVANFGGALQITQNFTNDADRLRAVISGTKMSHVDTADTTPGVGTGGGSGPTIGGGPATLSAPAAFGIRSVLLALRGLAKGLQNVPGRKMVVMLTEGFPLNAELQSEMSATIDACNKANVSVYPIDVRGLATGMPGPGISTPGLGRGGRGELGFLHVLGGGPSLASFSNSFQARGGGGGGAPGGGGGGGGAAGGGGGGGGRGGGGGGAPGGGASGGGAGGRGGSPGGGSPGGARPGGGNPGGGRPGGVNPGGGRAGGGMPNNPRTNNPYNNPMMRPTTIMPTIPPDISANQQALYMLANGTGGFVIVNTNDLLGGMEKIAREQDQYYIIGFTPVESAEGSCHTLKVKVDKGGESVRSRSGYCNVRQVDVLAGKPAETELEALAVRRIGGQVGRAVATPILLRVSQCGARQCGHGNPQFGIQVRQGQGQAARRDERPGHRLSGRQFGRREVQRHLEIRLRKQDRGGGVQQAACPLRKPVRHRQRPIQFPRGVQRRRR
ncbi:MAG: VWA domain-containing protein [Ignavibacteriota bacterium]